ncbi:MAG: hypothetical protein WCR72_00330 [Bacteroidota bacterium]
MSRKTLLFTISLFTLLMTAAYAQEPETFAARTGIGFVPQYSISGGLRFDIDRSLSKKTNQWIILSPQVFAVSGSRYGHDLKKLWGVGLDVKHKIYLKPESLKPRGYYVQYGLMFQYFSITDSHTHLEPYIEDGVEYYGISEREITTTLYKFGGNFHLGYQWLINDKVYFDIYTGAGIRISHNSRNKGFDTWYNDYWVDYGYSGTLLDGGLRIGFYF